MTQVFYPGSTSSGKPSGLFIASYIFSGDKYTYFFDGDKKVYINPIGAQASDLSQSLKKGTYSVQGDQLEIVYDDGVIKKRKYTPSASGFDWDPFFVVVVPVDWSKFSGTFEGGITSSFSGVFLGTSRTYEFYPDGSLTVKALNSVTTSPVSSTSSSTLTGRWSGDGYELTLELEGKSTKNIAYFPYSSSDVKSPNGFLYVNASPLKFKSSTLSAAPPPSVADFSSQMINRWPDVSASNNGVPGSSGQKTNVDVTFSSSSDLRELAAKWLDQPASSGLQTLDLSSNQTLNISASSWQGSIKLISVGRSTPGGARIDATQIVTGQGPQGSILVGDDGSDILWGRAGWDLIDGRDGDDSIRGGNGRDIITGGFGYDEMHGDFGWNTYTPSNDDYSDLIVVKSDQFLFNPLLASSGNNADGSKCDIIEELDVVDRIKILGVETSVLSFGESVKAHGLVGIGIYASGYLEALYTGSALGLSEIKQITTGELTAPAGGFFQTW